MKNSNRPTQEMVDHRRLILARRMAMRTRAGVACAPCRAKKVKCSDYRPCARCRDLRLGGRCQDDKYADKVSSQSNSEHACTFDTLMPLEDWRMDAMLTRSLMFSAMAPDHLASHTQNGPADTYWPWFATHWPISAAPDRAIPQPQHTGSTNAFPHEGHQVSHPGLPASNGPALSFMS
jgi:hypothetical protein